MVRVLSCHHFAAQDVFSPSHQPIAMCASQTHLFIATSHCYLEVHELSDKGCPQKYRIPTVSPVSSVVYCRADDYIATIEGLRGSEDATVRVYMNWQADLSQHPMRARVAGNMHCLKQVSEEGDTGPRLQVVEIPLKSAPLCIAADDHTGNLAVGFRKTVLIYGLCCKREPNTGTIYEDIKCLLEVKFNLFVENVAICEEFILVASKREFQAVKLNLDQIPLTVTKDLHLDVEDLAAKFERQRCRRTCEREKRKDANAKKALKRTESFFERLKQAARRVRSIKQRQVSNTYIVEDKHHFVLNVDVDVNSDSNDASEGSHVRERIWLESIKKAVEVEKSSKHKSKGLSDEMELLGPLKGDTDKEKCCAVSVEYEDHCDCNTGPSGALEKGVSTCVYRRLNFNTRFLHSLQFLPIYNPDCEDELDEEGWGTFTSNHRDHLCGLYCLISSDKEGYLYDVLSDRVQLLATYPYTAPVSQVKLEHNLLYAMSPSGLEIYTTRCQARTVESLVPKEPTPDTSGCIACTQQESHPVDLEPCIIGLQPFIGLRGLCSTQGNLALLSMQGDSWSMYVLQKPRHEVLYADMMELANAYKSSSMMAHIHLVQEAFLLLWSQVHSTNDQDSLSKLLSSSCLELAQLYGNGHIGKPKQCVQLFIQSKYSVDEILTKTASYSSQKGCDGRPAIMMYLDWLLFNSKEPVNAGHETGDRILEFYSKHDPAKLPEVILASNLSRYSTEVALKLVTKAQWANTSDKQRLEMLALATLHLQLGNQGEAEAHISSLSKNELITTCVEYASSIVEGTNTLIRLTPLAQLLRRHKPDIFVSVMSAFYKNALMKNSEIVELLQVSETNGAVNGKKSSNNIHLEAYLEEVAIGYEEKYIAEVAHELCAVYLSQLKDSPQEKCHHLRNGETFVCINTPENLIRRPGFFGKRHSWLDHLPPFSGPESLPRVPSLSYVSGSASLPSCSPAVTKSGPLQITSKQSIEDSAADSASPALCIKCTVHLLKLQSFLCSKHLTKEVYSTLLKNLDHIPEKVQGHTSLWLLCQVKVNSRTAIDQVIEDHPTIIGSFLQECFSKDMLDEWKYATQCLVQINRQLSKDTMPEMHATYSTALSDVLECICKMIPPDQLIALLPQDSNLTFFKKFVDSSARCYQLQQLKEAIVAQSAVLQSL